MGNFKYNSFRGKVTRIVDGDTADIDVDLGFYVHVSVRCRLVGVDTPERGHRDWEKATFAFATLVKENKDKEGYINFVCEKTGKYGRWLIDIPVVNSSLAEVWPYVR
tara:strand:+ start:5185 stop:5505 length:321 start_codon:yes stop_codon:yes gene_type:complete